MLVTFKTTAYADITMFGDAAEALLKLMGQSGNVPGAIMADDVAPAMEKLKSALADQPTDTGEGTDANNGSNDEDDRTSRVALATRAVPLLELLEAAAASGANVMWDT